jgi:hypothetical protein
MPTQAKEIFAAQTKSLFELLSDNGLGLYLPPYQRPYGWGKGKVAKLLDDTVHGLRNLDEAPDSFTFLGTIITIHDVNHVTMDPIVKPEVPGKVLTVIDGQQRLSSLLLLLVSVHNLIRQQSWKVFRGKAPDSSDAARVALYSETTSILQMLGTAFYERKNYGTTPIYPRLIRAFFDQWSRNEKDKLYESPIAHLVYSYSVMAEEEALSAKPTDFRPKARSHVGEGEEDLVRRFSEIRICLSKLAQRKTVEDLEDLPPLLDLASKIESQRALFNHELDLELCKWLGGLEDEPEAVLMRLVMFAAYVLNRIALTVVQGKDEDYAFTIFESLNTTGEPLTAFETFLPRVVMAEGLQLYLDSDAHGYMKAVQGYLDRFDVGDKLQGATADLLVTFALAETGKKLPKRLPDQRAYMNKETFDRHKDSGADRAAYLRHLCDAATFTGTTWDPLKGATRQLAGLPVSAMTDVVKLCLAFLKDLAHTIAIAPLVRFYSEAVQAEGGDEREKRIAEFETAIKAITAFTVFWRASRRGTGNIDSQYRALMAGESLTGMGPLARTWGDPKRLEPEPTVDAEALKKELAARLSDPGNKYGGIPNLASFLAAASALPLYTINKDLTRFLLLAAYHDTTEDLANPGLIIQGKAGISPCFTSDGWVDEPHFTIEHIAPQQETAGWKPEFYSDKEVVHRLGNLVLAPGAANSSLSSRPWTEKKVLYAALGAPTAEDAKAILNDSGLVFAQSTEELAQMSRYLPHLRALGLRDAEWDPAFMDQRAQVLLRLDYARLKDWLGLEWSESSTDPVVHVGQEIDIDEDDLGDGSVPS